MCIRNNQFAACAKSGQRSRGPKGSSNWPWTAHGAVGARRRTTQEQAEYRTACK
ncbi:hypothetical protein FOMG_19000 [Fusarium oxysporum f. sp. melonis 26406]|uniref:Uncharacterized protein n=1 Tax=Fusarium oxysporum f. sp. melonis 26406 TaxID=1089452 RepID=W9YXH4_FUSOX|nr:hypothetical protein FOMG_19000 [Fusarium oxysporum f. sp. melonis 26406]